ncbi:histidine kinase-like protein [Streptomyces sp. 1114.5]|uniref:ATP-binding protein n=1 Tax=Streptomyces sp. 1114.5 TaxID=1938830 RepID=UPI000EB3BD47|nr:ATP-binding protein [Streptomyces sp. 1114.5]RKT17576.1 histidine kinase-like protein [Streptomyces sp. 1114.5]
MCTRNTPSLTLSRQALRDVLARNGWDTETIFNAELALMELIVNAWRHGNTTAPVVWFSLLGCTLRVTVSDENDALPQQRTPADFSETGRGLQLVQGLTHRWGVDPLKRGKSVWYELDSVA